MKNKMISKGILALAVTSALTSTAMAGGWNRGEADTDILFEPGTVVSRAGITYVSPRRDYSTVNGATATDERFSQDYVIPSFAAKWQATEKRLPIPSRSARMRSTGRRLKLQVSLGAGVARVVKNSSLMSTVSPAM